MKRFLSLILAVAVALSLSLAVAGCSRNAEPEDAETVSLPITEKVYIYNNPSVPRAENEFQFSFLWFNTDGTFQALEVSGVSNYVSSYGTYEIEDNAVTMNYGGASFAGVVREEGKHIYFGDADFLDWTDHTKADDPIYDEITH